MNPENARYYNDLGVAQRRLGLYEEALKSYKQAIELDPEDVYSYYMLGLSQDKVGLERLAVESFKTYLNLDGYKDPECEEYAKRRVNDSHAMLH